MKRQRGRNRGGGGGSGGGKPQAQNANRAFDSNGPEGIKVRGNAQHVFEKYQQLARDANSAGDRVLGENYLQHAEHYFRLLRAMQPTRPASEILGRDNFSSGFDIDFEDETAQAQSEAADAAAPVGALPPEGAEPVEAAWQGGGERPRDEQRPPREDRPRYDRDDRPRDDRPRDDRPRGDRYENRDSGQGGQGGQGRRDRWRDDRPRDDRPRDDRPRGDQPRADQPRDDRPREDRPRDDRPRYDRDDRNRDDRPRFDRNRDDRPERDPLAVVEPQAQPLVTPAAESRPEPRERPARVLRDADGGESHAPAFLQAPAARATEAAGGDVAPKPRRRRAPRPDAAASEAEEA
jgi:hypothetical protein